MNFQFLYQFCKSCVSWCWDWCKRVFSSLSSWSSHNDANNHSAANNNDDYHYNANNNDANNNDANQMPLAQRSRKPLFKYAINILYIIGTCGSILLLSYFSCPPESYFLEILAQRNEEMHLIDLRNKAEAFHLLITLGQQENLKNLQTSKEIIKSTTEMQLNSLISDISNFLWNNKYIIIGVIVIVGCGYFLYSKDLTSTSTLLNIACPVPMEVPFEKISSIYITLDNGNHLYLSKITESTVAAFSEGELKRWQDAWGLLLLEKLEASIKARGL